MTQLTVAELEQAWRDRCTKGNFSKAILGLGVVRIMGKSGDASVFFPRITSLAALSSLSEDEQHAVLSAQRIVEQAREQQRTVFSVSPGQTPERLTDFRPDAESLMVVARIAGG